MSRATLAQPTYTLQPTPTSYTQNPSKICRLIGIAHDAAAADAASTATVAAYYIIIMKYRCCCRSGGYEEVLFFRITFRVLI